MPTPYSCYAKAGVPYKVSLDTGRYARCTAGGRKCDLVVIKIECMIAKALVVPLFWFHSSFLIKILYELLNFFSYF